jgi:hypothetical protein
MSASAVAPGESFGLVGESGSGKSTILRTMMGFSRRLVRLRCKIDAVMEAAKSPAARQSGTAAPRWCSRTPMPRCIRAMSGRPGHRRTHAHPQAWKMPRPAPSNCSTSSAWAASSAYPLSRMNSRAASASASPSPALWRSIAKAAAARRAHLGPRRLDPGRNPQPAQPASRQELEPEFRSSSATIMAVISYMCDRLMVMQPRQDSRDAKPGPAPRPRRPSGLYARADRGELRPDLQHPQCHSGAGRNPCPWRTATSKRTDSSHAAPDRRDQLSVHRHCPACPGNPAVSLLTTDHPNKSGGDGAYDWAAWR